MGSRYVVMRAGQQHRAIAIMAVPVINVATYHVESEIELLE